MMQPNRNSILDADICLWEVDEQAGTEYVYVEYVTQNHTYLLQADQIVQENGWKTTVAMVIGIRKQTFLFC